MNYEIITIIGAWASLAWFIWNLNREMHNEFSRIHKEMGDMRERLARVEGTIDLLKDLFQSALSGKYPKGDKL